MMNQTLRRLRHEKGQSLPEFLFVIIFFMMFVAFLRSFVYFELDAFNQTNLARYRVLHFIRGRVGGKSFGREYEQRLRSSTDSRSKLYRKPFLRITTSRLRPIPFLLPSNSPRRNIRLPQRELVFAAGTKYNWMAYVYGDASIAIAVLMLGFNA